MIHVIKFLTESGFILMKNTACEEDFKGSFPFEAGFVPASFLFFWYSNNAYEEGISQKME